MEQHIQAVLLFDRPVAFYYTNHRDESNIRHVYPIGLDFGANEYYPEPQWLLRTWDYAKEAHRSFALDKISIPSVAPMTKYQVDYYADLIRTRQLSIPPEFLVKAYFRR